MTATVPAVRDHAVAGRRPSGIRHLTLEQVAPWLGCAWLALMLTFRWPAWWSPSFQSESTLDSSFFAYAGELVRLGSTPYLTFWDHKAPLIFLIDAAALALSGGRIWGLWLLNLAELVGATLLGHAVMKWAFGAGGAAGASAAMLGTTVYAFSLAALMPVNLTEGYVLPLQWAAVFLLVQEDTFQENTSRRAAWASGAALGLLGAFAFYLRPNLIGAALCVGLVLMTRMVLARRSRDALAWVAGALGAFALVTLALVAYLASAGALAAFWDQAFHYNFMYAASEWRAKGSAMYFGAFLTTRYASAVIPLAGWLLCAGRLVRGWSDVRERRDSPAFALYLLALIWLPVELMLASMSGRHYGHYFAPALAPVALLAAVFVAELVRPLPPVRESASPGWGPRVARLLTVAIAIWAVLGGAMNLARDKHERARTAQVADTAAYVRSSTADDARLLVWGHASDVHFLSGRLPASRFVYPLALLTPRYADAALVGGFVSELRTSAPELIIDATPNSPEGEDIVPTLDAWNPEWRYPRHAPPGRHWWSMTPELRSFYDHVRDNYVAVGTVGERKWVVYRRLPQTARNAAGR